MELCIDNVLLCAGTRSSFGGRDRFDLDVVHLGPVASQRIVHLHRTHQHLLIVARQ